jgi:tRNA dimethylallyltransferase
LDLAGDTFEIVSSDSVQVYRYLDIGSGKPDKEARAAVRHHLIDIVDPEYPFTAGEFCKRAMLASEEIESRNRIPFFVGGRVCI